MRTAPPTKADSPGSTALLVDSRPSVSRGTARGRTLESLTVRNFRVFLSGLLLASTGVRAQRIGQDWLVLTMTGSPAAVGLTTACQFLPSLFLGLHGGLLADRFPKLRLLQVTRTSMTAFPRAEFARTSTRPRSRDRGRRPGPRLVHHRARWRRAPA